MASVTRKTHNARAARRDEIGRRLLVAVESLLAEGESFTEVSVERLVTEARISRSTFSVYFQDKGHLPGALTARVWNTLDDGARPRRGAEWRRPATRRRTRTEVH